jgi:phosphonatase-like hydrolase
MGQSKIHVFTELLGDIEKASRANEAFERSYIEEITQSGASPIPGTIELFKELKSRGIAVALTSGFSRTTLDVLLDILDWHELIDISVTPSEVKQGRPHPDMLNLAAQKLMLSDPTNSIVVGDTAADMQAGIAFGALNVIGVLTGVHTAEVLIEAGATSVLNSVVDLTSLL